MKLLINSVLRIIAVILIIVTVIPSLISLLLLLFETYEVVSDTNASTIFIWSLQIFLNLIIALILWFFSDRITDLIISTDQEKLSLSIDTSGILEIGIVLIGIYFLVAQTPELLSNIYSYLFETKQNHFTIINATSLKGIIISLITVIISFYLIVDRKKIITKINEYKRH